MAEGSRSSAWLSDSQPPVCLHFQAHGTCRFGDRCRFAHDRARSSSRKRHCSQPGARGAQQTPSARGAPARRLRLAPPPPPPAAAGAVAPPPPPPYQPPPAPPPAAEAPAMRAYDPIGQGRPGPRRPLPAHVPAAAPFTGAFDPFRPPAFDPATDPPLLDAPHPTLRGISHREWIVKAPPPPDTPPPAATAVVRVMTYNVLADCLARDHMRELYPGVPRWTLAWQHRRRLIVAEVAHYAPSILSLQEVDDFRGFRRALAPLGYDGLHVQRTGGKRDGCALFWRTDHLQRVEYKQLNFNRLDLKDNVAQVLALRPTGALRGTAAGATGQPALAGAGGAAPEAPGLRRVPGRAPGQVFFEDAVAESAGDEDRGDDERGCDALPDIVVGNIHVLFNPKRGDVKLGQVRTLCEEVRAVAARLYGASVGAEAARSGGGRPADGGGASASASGRAPSHGAVAVVMGDFNCVPDSDLYKFVIRSSLCLDEVVRAKVSGQLSHHMRDYTGLENWVPRCKPLPPQPRSESRRAATPPSERLEGVQRRIAHATLCDAAGDGGTPQAALERAARLSHACESAPARLGEEAGCATPPQEEAGPSRAAMREWATGDETERGRPFGGCEWDFEELRNALGPRFEADDVAEARLTHPLAMVSAFCDVAGYEPAYTTRHEKFVGPVDYMFYTPCGVDGSDEGGEGHREAFMRARATLAPRPWCELSPPGLPAPAEGSDHVCLVTDFEFGFR